MDVGSRVRDGEVLAICRLIIPYKLALTWKNKGQVTLPALFNELAQRKANRKCKGRIVPTCDGLLRLSSARP